MTNQEAFDIVSKHLLSQGKKSKRGKLNALRGDAGTKCALGALVPEYEYEEGLEAQYVVLDKVVPALAGMDPAFLHRLRDVHDAFDVEQWPAALHAVARDYELDPGIVGGAP